MTFEEIYERLCTYDSRNPLYEDLTMCLEPDEIPQPRREGCFCDNCFYGRDKLALEILRLMERRDIDLFVKDGLSGKTRMVTVRHGDFLSGLDVFEVRNVRDICPKDCEWCELLKKRIRSRAGRGGKSNE